MNRLLSSLCLLLILLAACQPVRPESELTPATSDETTRVITDTLAITETAAITTTEVTTAVTSSTPTGNETRATTPAMPVADPSDSLTTCPALRNDAGDIFVIANWHEGDQRTYLVSQRSQDNASGQDAVTMASTTVITVTVVSADEDGYVLEWSFGQPQLGETDIEVDDPFAAIFQMPLQIAFRVATDIDGAYLELLDIEELQTKLIPLFDQLFDLVEEMDEDLSPEALQAARDLVDRLVQDPANFEGLFTREVQLFHSLFGFYFEDGAPLVLPDMRPNLLGGSPIPSELTITPTHYDADAGCLHVELENVADPVAARDSILEALQEQARQMGVPGPSDDDLPAELSLVDRVRFEFDLQSGWPIAIHTERAVNIATQSRLETTTIVIVEPK